MSSSEFGIGDQNLCTLLAGLELQLIWTSQFTPFVRQQFVGPGAEGTRPTTNKAFMGTELEQRLSSQQQRPAQPPHPCFRVPNKSKYLNR